MIKIITYQDLLEVGNSEKKRMDFVEKSIRSHKSSMEYITAETAEKYFRHENPTINNFQKFIYNQFGKAVPDAWSANNKISSNWYNYFIVQSIQYLLGNGITFKNPSTIKKLGKNFENNVQNIATRAKNGGVAFGFWNLDHIEVFPITEFVPLWDEENGSLSAGIRFWQIEENRPLRATLYEIDGYTNYIKRKSKDMEILSDKATYKKKFKKAEIGGEILLDGENYPSFPIVPFWNTDRKSELSGNRGTIDAYDLMISGLINNVSDGEFIYWILKNCNGMDDIDDMKFLEQLKITHIAHAGGDDGSDVDAHKVDVPFQASGEALDRLKEQLFKDFMALKVEEISAASVTNDQIQAAYEPLNQKTDRFEYQVTEFIEKILEIAGIDDEPSYSRSQMSNKSETINMVLSASSYLSEEYITEKIMTILGDSDRVQEILKQKEEAEANRYYIESTNKEEEDNAESGD